MVHRLFGQIVAFVPLARAAVQVRGASGIDAAEVLPVSAMSRATATLSGNPSFLIMASVIRMFAWCGMKTSRSSTPIPALSSASLATLAIS